MRQIGTFEQKRGVVCDSEHRPSSYALAATLAAMLAEIFLMLENGG